METRGRPTVAMFASSREAARSAVKPGQLLVKACEYVNTLSGLSHPYMRAPFALKLSTMRLVTLPVASVKLDNPLSSSQGTLEAFLRRSYQICLTSRRSRTADALEPSSILQPNGNKDLVQPIARYRSIAAARGGLAIILGHLH